VITQNSMTLWAVVLLLEGLPRKDSSKYSSAFIHIALFIYMLPSCHVLYLELNA
jgi:hypothetical protein